MSIELPGTRREFLSQSAFGVGAFALAYLLKQDGLLAVPANKLGENLPLNLRPRAPHYAPRAKHSRPCP